MAYYTQEPWASDPSIRQQAVKIAVVLVNLGTPDAPTPGAIRRYLAQFLADRRIIEAPRWLWYPILHGIVLRTRPKKVAHAYASIWTENGSPLLDLTTKLAAKVASQFNGRVIVTTAMRYGSPSLHNVLDSLKQQNVQKLLLLPMFPQYSASTTASIMDNVMEIFGQWRVLPDFRFISQYANEATYLDAIASQIKSHRDSNGSSDTLVFSFHGLPQQYVDAGDVYQEQCLDTAKGVADRLSLGETDWLCCFQSRFGPKQWLMPYTDETLKALPKQGVKSVDVICPGFAVDCLETVEEINIQNREFFLAAGGDRFHYIPALNDSDLHANVLSAIVNHNIQDWLNQGD